MKYIVLLSLLFTVAGANAQPPAVPVEASSFVIKGYEVLDYIAGDLNGDKRKDALLILKAPGEDTAFGEERTRPFLLLIRQSNGKLQQAVRNDSVIMCRMCGGVFGDPYNGITITPGGFTLSFYGGSSWRWGYDYQFVYRALSNTWFLVKETQSSFQAGDPDATMKKSVIPASEMPSIGIGEFSSTRSFEGSKWKVKAVKTYFYDSPILGSKPRKGYLVKGNVASAVRQLNNFIEISFDDGKGNFTNGFILRKDLQLIDIK